MTPTNKLRFVERTRPDYPGALTGRIIHVLQQWWEGVASVEMGGSGSVYRKIEGEWRDVPLEKEAP